MKDFFLVVSFFVASYANPIDCNEVKSTSLQTKNEDCVLICRNGEWEKFNDLCAGPSAAVPEISKSPLVSEAEPEPYTKKSSHCKDCPDGDKCKASCCWKHICKSKDTCASKCLKCQDPNKNCKSKTLRNCAGQCKAWDTCPTGACNICDHQCKALDSCSGKCAKCFDSSRTKSCKSKTYNKCVGQCKSEDTCETACKSGTTTPRPTLSPPDFGCSALKQRELNLLLVTDLTDNMKSKLSNIKSRALKGAEGAASYFRSYKLGAAHFQDHPISPLGIQTDNCFTIDRHMTAELELFDAAVKAYEIVDGSGGIDAGDYQLGSVVEAAYQTRWSSTSNVERMLFLVTDGTFNTFVNGLSAGLDNYPGYTSHVCGRHTYPANSNVAEALLANQVTPVFLVPEKYVDNYLMLTNELRLMGVAKFSVVVVKDDFSDLDAKMEEAILDIYCPWKRDEGSSVDCGAIRAGTKVDLHLSLDTTRSMRVMMPNIDVQLPGVFEQVVGTYSEPRFSQSTFRDKPVPPMGVQQDANGVLKPDHCYDPQHMLIADYLPITQNIARLDIDGGGDVYNAQLDSILNVGMDETLVWRNGANTQRYLIMVTDSPYHLPAYGLGEGLLPSPGNSTHTCDKHTYPSMEQAAYWLKAKSIIPIFLVPESVAEWYTRLLNEWEIYGVVSILSYDASNFGAAFTAALDEASCDFGSEACKGFEGVNIHGSDILLSVDAGKQTGALVAAVGNAAATVYETLGESYLNPRYKVSIFQDKPISPFGNDNFVCYESLSDGWSVEKKIFLDITSKLEPHIKDGGDLADSQLDALLLGAQENFSDNDMNYNFLVLITNTPYHIASDGVIAELQENTGDNAAYDCVRHSYPTINRVREELVKRRIMPVFVVPQGLIETYNMLLSQLEVAGAVSPVGDNYSNLSDAILRGISAATCARMNFVDYEMSSDSQFGSVFAMAATCLAMAV